MLSKIYNFIDDYIRDNPCLQLICIFVLWGVFFIISLLFLFDSTPATEKDYQPLIVQQEKIANDFNTVYSYNNYTIAPKENYISVTLSNEQCELICSFDKDLKLKSYEKNDKAFPKVKAIFGALISGLLLGGGFAIILIMVIPFILSLLLKLLEKICLFLVNKEGKYHGTKIKRW